MSTDDLEPKEVIFGAHEVLHHYEAYNRHLIDAIFNRMERKVVLDAYRCGYGIRTRGTWDMWVADDFGVGYSAHVAVTFDAAPLRGAGHGPTR